MPDQTPAARRAGGASFALNQKGHDLLAALVAGRRPARMLELGSGRSTAMLAAAAAAYGAAVVSLEHHETYLHETRRAVGSHATVVHAPIRFVRVGALWGWCYEPAGGWDALGTFDFAFIDGPPARAIGRWMTLPLIWPLLRPGSLVVVHDADRALEQRWLRLWRRRYGTAAAFDLEMAPSGLALITKLTEGGRPGPRSVLEFGITAIVHRARAMVSRARRRAPRI